MPDSVQLPFCVPVFATTQGAAAPGLALANEPSAYNYLLNQNITLRCTRKFIRGFSSPEVCVDKLPLGCFSNIYRYAASFRLIHQCYKQIIKDMLNQGFYVYYYGVDDFYLPGKSWYGTRHMHHDGIICGYDDTDNTYSIAAYDINWVFNLIRIPQECFDTALKSSISELRYGAITAYKVKNEEIKLDPAMILKGLKEYIALDFDKYSIDEDGPVRGIAVHDFLAYYINKLKDGSIPSEKMDWRALRPVWEQKKCMYDRIRAVEDNYAWEHSLSDSYRPIVENANRVRAMYAVCHKTQKLSLLEGIANGLLEIKKKEKEILEILIKKMEEI